uniref:Uncharacterized protein n=1 Tax=Streptomyces sp. NBC_00003 TaxID=2903608 RepID=A0AAU2V704_9ACTN
MYRQPELPFGIPDGGATDERPSLDELFDSFHAENPWVCEALEELTSEWLEAGGGRVGMKALFERLRWQMGIQTNGRPFKLNNNFTSRYTRLLCARHPEWNTAFEVRKLRSGDSDH